MGSKCLFWMLLEPSISYIGKKQGRYGFGYGLWLWLPIWLQYLKVNVIDILGHYVRKK